MSAQPVPTAVIADLARRGLTQSQIAAQVGMTRQGVSYRLRTPASRPRRSQERGEIGPSTWHPRPSVPPPASCGPCGRYVGRTNAKLGPASLLREPECCRYCSRPLTEAAKAAAPVAGYVAIARVMAREPASVRSHRVAEVDA